jgi:hypothetical protein
LRFMHCVGSKFSYSCLVRAVSGVERQTHHFAFHALCFIHALLFKLCTWCVWRRTPDPSLAFHALCWIQVFIFIPCTCCVWRRTPDPSLAFMYCVSSKFWYSCLLISVQFDVIIIHTPHLACWLSKQTMPKSADMWSKHNHHSLRVKPIIASREL